MSEQLWREINSEERAQFLTAPRSWLASQMTPEMPWLLVHADDGVIWGWRQADGVLALSSEVAGLSARYPTLAVKLRQETLQQARVFGPAGEVLVWRSDNGFDGRRIMDGESLPAGAFHEQHLLWGGRVAGNESFTVLEEGSQGQVHAVPLPVPGRQRAALTVRHYAETDRQGQAAVVLSRLFDLGLYKPGKGS